MEGTKLKNSPKLMIVSDLDNTMVDHQDEENLSLLRFNALWEANYRDDSLLVFSTGRSRKLYKELRNEKPMLTPNITIMSVGTEISYGDSMIPDEGWEKVLDQGWNRAIVIEEASKFPQLKFQVESEQRPHKISFYVEKNQAPEVIDTLSKKLKDRQLNVKLIYSGGIDLDILPIGAGKGQALAYLLKKFSSESTSPKNTLVCGDSGNDAELFSVADVYGVMVGNAQEELLQWYERNAKGNPKVFLAQQRCAAGILQAMKHFGLDPYISPRDSPDINLNKTKKFVVGHEVVEFHLLCEKWRKGEIANSDDTFQLLKTRIDPYCSLVQPWGAEQKFCSTLEALRNCHGDQKGKRFYSWIDKIRHKNISSDVWLVTFDKWELIDGKRCCYVTTAVLKQKSPNSLSWLHVHETWLDGFGRNANACCAF